MKRTKLILSLLAVPFLLNACGDSANDKATENAPAVNAAESTPAAKPENAVKAPEENVFYQQLVKSFEKEEESIFRAGYMGDTAVMNTLKDEDSLVIYSRGAALAGRTELVQQGIEKGAKPDRIINGAARGGHTQLVLLLLEKGADASIGARNAAMGGHTELVKLLLEKGADATDAVYSAALGGHTELVLLLLDKNAAIGDALNGAVYAGHVDLVKLLLEKGADPNKGMGTAIKNGHVEILKLLLANPNIDVNHRYSSSAPTPLDIAEKNGQQECAELIRAAGGKKSSEL